MNSNKIIDYTKGIEGGKTCRFEAIGSDGRIHIEGTGPIVVEVSVDGAKYALVEHDVSFVNGVAIAPVSFCIGDQVRISATTLTKVTVNYNKIKSY